MPDTWEYPWFAAWDLAYQCCALALIDIDFSKQQIELLLKENYLHPNGQIPAYEWEYGDVNPPVHAMAALKVFRAERVQRGVSDLSFLQRVFNKLLLNYAWWINRKDSEGHNVFEGGFMGLDNISVLNRSQALPPGFKLRYEFFRVEGVIHDKRRFNSDRYGCIGDIRNINRLGFCSHAVLYQG